MLSEFDQFVEFCLEHGVTLRNHKAFGDMVRELRSKIEFTEQTYHQAKAIRNPGDGTLILVTKCPKCRNVFASPCDGVTSPIN